MCLRGSAQRLLSDLTEYQIDDYDEIKMALMKRFCPSERESAYRCEFRTCKRTKTDTAADYGYMIKKLACKAFPSMSSQARENVVIDQYISGLGDQELKRHVQFGHPKTLDEAIRV